MIISACVFVTLTFYTLTGGAADRAAYGGRVQPGKTCAASPDLGRQLKGKTIAIDGFGARLVNDRTGGKMSLHIDVAVANREVAKRLGKRRGRICW